MTAYSFNRRFVPPILAGLEPGPWMPGMKRHTIRALRTGRGRHARAGEQVQLYTGMRTKQCRLLGRARCTDLGEITIDLHHELIAGRLFGEPFRAVGTAHLDAFAKRDGFADWAAMRSFWREEHAGIALFVGNVIAWVPAPLGVPACRNCGCTEDRACPGGCWWVKPDLCSACAERKAA